MDDKTKSNLSDPSIWSRGLYMVLMAIAFGVTEALIAIVAIFQFLSALVTREVSKPLHEFGANLSAYAFQIAQFVTFQTEEKPFPFADWPNVDPGTTPWDGEDSNNHGGVDHGKDDQAEVVVEANVEIDDADPKPAT